MPEIRVQVPAPLPKTKQNGKPMGYMRHHAIIVTSWDQENLVKAHNQASSLIWQLELPHSMLGPILGPTVNGMSTFLIAPDGSKEFWDTSENGDELRKQFTTWLDEQRYSDGSSCLDWVEVQYGDEKKITKIICDSDSPTRKDFEHG